LHSSDSREGRGTVAFFAEPLSDTGVDEVSEVFREPCLLCGVRLNDSELCRHFDAFVQIPPVQVIRIWICGHASASSSSGDCTRDFCGWALSKRSEERRVGKEGR